MTKGVITIKVLVLMTFDIFRFSLGASLERLGHEVRYVANHDFDVDQLSGIIDEFKPDLAIDMGWDVWHLIKYLQGQLGYISDCLKRKKVFHVYFAEEDWLHYDRWSKRYCAIMQPDFVLTRSPSTIPKYEQLGIPTTYFDVGCNTDFHKPYDPNPMYACDIAVVANGNFALGETRYRSVGDLVVPLLERGYNLKIWGRHWEQIGKFYPSKALPAGSYQGLLPFAETPQVYSSAKICISIQTSRDQLSNRTFDILSSGGFLLTSGTKAAREKLRHGVNCVTSSNPAETLELVEYYLNHEEERKEIAKRGRQAAMEQFDYTISLKSVWKEIEYEWHRYQKLANQQSAGIAAYRHKPNILQESWQCYHAEQIPLTSHGARTGVKMDPHAGNAYIQQKVMVEVGKTYFFSCRLAKEGTLEGPPLTIFVQYYSAEQKLLDCGMYGTIFSTDLSDAASGEWMEYRGITKTVPDGTAYALVIINKFHDKTSAPVLVSEFRMQEIVL